MLIVAQGILIVAGKDIQDKLVEPCRLKSVQAVVVSNNQAGAMALLFNDAAQVMLSMSHLVFETASLGLLLRYILNG